MNEQAIRQLLEDVAASRCGVDNAVARLRTLPFENVEGFARLDHHRELRRGIPEAIYCAGKTPEQVASIFERLAAGTGRALGTRATIEQFAAARLLVPALQHDPVSRCIWLEQEAPTALRDGVQIITAGTSDIPVAAEASLTLRLLGYSAPAINDIGVAGIHRLFDQLAVLRRARVLIVIAGMEGALPSAVAGLVAAPVLAVPTSVGYGASFGGLAALLAMLTGCAPGVGVVNIDNGFGAACLAASILNIIQADQDIPHGPRT